jgi:hypothetical protein
MQIHHPNFKKYLQKEKITPKLEEIHKPPHKNKINKSQRERERERERERLQGKGKNNEGDERSTKHVYYVKE